VNFWYIHYTELCMSLCNYDLFQKVKGPLCGIRMRDEIMSAIEHAITDISRRDAAGGVRHLPQVLQCVCTVAGECT
jgi:hypothetical protein